MTSANILARLQTLLDDADDGHWSSTEMYQALTDGQNAFIKKVMQLFIAKRMVNIDVEIPYSLRILLTSTTGTTTTTLPSNYLLWIAVYTSSGTVFVRDKSASYSAKKNNTYLQSSSDQPYCSITATQIILETAVGYTFEYLKKPNDIDGSNNPTLEDVCLEAVLYYAFAQLLRKDKRINESNAAFQTFNYFVDQTY